jgi:hypothetical protein
MGINKVFVPLTIHVLAVRPGIPDLRLDRMANDPHWNEIDLDNSNLDISPLRPHLAWCAWKTNKKLRRQLRGLFGAELMELNCRIEVGPDGRPVVAEVLRGA